MAVKENARELGPYAVDRFCKRIELTESGVRISRSGGIYRPFDTFIPYRDLRMLVFVRATIWGDGYMTLLTSAPHKDTLRYLHDPSIGAAFLRANGPFTVSFHRSGMKRVEPIYKALLDIQCANEE